MRDKQKNSSLIPHPSSLNSTCREPRNISAFCFPENFVNFFDGSHQFVALQECPSGGHVLIFKRGNERATLLHDQVLINLRAEWPPFFSRFQRLVEIVSLDEEDCGSARGRFRFYRDRGYAIQTHDLSASAQ